MILKFKKIFALFTASLLVASAISSCQFRPLEDYDSTLNINVAVNIKAIANITCDVYNELIEAPAINTDMMHVMFFDPNTDLVAAESYIFDSEISYDSEGNAQRVLKGDINVRPGKYKMLIYNFDTESTLIRNQEHFNTIEAYPVAVPENISMKYNNIVPTGASKAEEEEEEEEEEEDKDKHQDKPNIIFPPDHLVLAKSSEENIPYHTGVYTIQTEASSIVESYYLQIKVDGLQFVSNAQAILSGMVYSKILGEEDMANGNATLYFTLEKSQSPRDGNADVLCCVFNTFGRIDTSSNQLQVTFDVKTTYGANKQYTFDIADLFETENCIKHHWLLIDEEIKVDAPPPGSSGGGFDPVVEDWDHEDHTVNF